MDKENEIEEVYDIIERVVEADIIDSSANSVDYNLAGARRAAEEIVDAGYHKYETANKYSLSEKETDELGELLLNKLKELFVGSDDEDLALNAAALGAALETAGYRKVARAYQD